MTNAPRLSIERLSQIGAGRGPSTNDCAAMVSEILAARAPDPVRSVPSRDAPDITAARTTLSSLFAQLLADEGANGGLTAESRRRAYALAQRLRDELEGRHNG